MISITFNRGVKWCVILFIIVCFDSLLHVPGSADETNPPITVILGPDLGHGILMATVKNGGDLPLKIFPKVKDGFPPDGYVSPKYIYLCVLYSRKNTSEIKFSDEEQESMMTFGDGMTSPIEIAPGKSQKITFNLPLYIVKIWENTGEINLAMGLNNSLVKRLSLKKIKNVWTD